MSEDDEDDRYMAFVPISPRLTYIGLKEGDIISDSWPDSSTAAAVNNVDERRMLKEYEGDVSSS